MNFPTAVKTCLSEKFATFSGRASRSEYWWFVLAYALGAIVTTFLAGWLYAIYALALITPAAAAGYRRLQDTGRQGWYIFVPIGLALLGALLSAMGSTTLLSALGIVQLIVGLVFLWWLTRPSQPEANQFGPPPSP